MSNSNMEEDIMSVKVPVKALSFHDNASTACVESFGEGEEKKEKLKMTIYSGKPITGHWYWGDLVIDGKGIQFTKNRYPILESHDVDKKVAFSDGIVVDGKGKVSVDPEKTVFVDTPESQEFRRLSSDGFPYESSISARPTRIEKLEEGAKTEVNGFTMTGPASIWRECVFREGSVCVFGADKNTNAKVSNSEFEELEFAEVVVKKETKKSTENKKREEVKEEMTLDELKEKHPELVTKLTEEVTAKFNDEKKKNDAEMDKMRTIMSELQKDNEIRKENELKANASAIWARCLAESDIPEHLFEKVENMVQYNKFVKDGKFDIDAFTQKVKEEIKDWEDKGISNVQGFSTTVKGSAGDSEQKAETEMAKNDDSAVDRMLGYIGQEINKD